MKSLPMSTSQELEPLLGRLAKARRAYPEGCSLVNLVEEIGEVARAMRREGPDRVRDELLDVATIAMRLYAGEWCEP